LLDLSSAFNTIDHTVLIDRLKTRFGLNGTVLKWFGSYLSNRTQSIVIDGTASSLFLPDVRCPLEGPYSAHYCSHYTSLHWRIL
jgi:hypothetical protein